MIGSLPSTGLGRREELTPWEKMQGNFRIRECGFNKSDPPQVSEVRCPLSKSRQISG